jgi:hypothetical protein
VSGKSARPAGKEPGPAGSGKVDEIARGVGGCDVLTALQIVPTI